MNDVSNQAMTSHRPDLPAPAPARGEAVRALDPDAAWALVLARDPHAGFVYAVRTTGIFCRTGCPSRRPAPANVLFFQQAEEALAAGFRPCLRCRPLAQTDAQDSRWIETICSYLRCHVDRAVTLEELGRAAAMKPMTLQKKFHGLLGMTPRQFQMAQRAAGFRDRVAAPERGNSGATVTAALYDAGYSGSSRLYSDAQQTLGMTPARFRDGGRGESIVFITAPCVLGHLLVAATSVGICWVALGDSPQLLAAGLRDRFHQADRVEAGSATGESTSLLKAAVETVLSQLSDHPVASRLPLDLRATVFQQRVWRALAAIPRGQTRSYREVACELGQPAASRAVARACASNPVALLVPCHRVIGTDGSLSGYRWGLKRKQAVLTIEKAFPPQQ